MRLAIIVACLIIILAALTFEVLYPRCTPGSPRGTAIGGVLRIEGCP